MRLFSIELQFSQLSTVNLSVDCKLLQFVFHSQCFRLVWAMYLVKQWWSYTAPSVVTSTHPSPPATITLTGPTLVPGFLTCCSWFTLNTGQSDLPRNSSQGCTASRSTRWRTSSNNRLQLVLKLLWERHRIITVNGSPH